MALTPDAQATGSGSVMPEASGWVRALVRFWFALFFHKIRLLNAEKAEEENPAIFVVSHPGSFLDALILATAFEREAHCLVDERLVRGLGARFLARRLGMIAYDGSEEGWRLAVETSCAVLAGRKALIVFADQRTPRAGAERAVARTAARLALEAESRETGELQVTLFPVHLLLPVARSRSTELLVYVDSPVLQNQPPGDAGKAPAPNLDALAATLEAILRNNAFRLPSEDLAYFLEDLEELLRTDLAEDWASRPNWKQDAEGFKLSRFVKVWAGQMNFLNPGRLIAMRESLAACREMRRRIALHRLEVETARSWLDSSAQRLAAYLESIVGLPVALYGLLNHLGILLVLRLSGSFKPNRKRDRAGEWVLRSAVALGFYTAQVLLVAHFLGRAAAGYYAPTLPLTGVYLLRYAWLLRHRTRLLLLALLMPRQAARARRLRKQFLEELDRSLSPQETTLGAPH